jgi:hypothetical protein
MIHTQIECRSAGVSVLLLNLFRCSRIVYVACLCVKELVESLFIGTVVLLSLFFPGSSKTSGIGDSVELSAFDENA